ncbi:hypothetical protein IAQ61_006680 [Plenodomus lingam]|uniref:uncharacterized protein n=1 Tax=Leptosphaeria maculans TaxID=5022 RepID=UPI0033348A0B|nr:hypothetical protein IAQ61_006680 [Plenodomus lingam]
MPSPKDTTITVLPHLSLFAGFGHPTTDTPHPAQMRDGTPRNPHRDGNINAMTQAEFDALPTWSDIEDDPEDNRLQQRPRDGPPRYSTCMQESCLTPLLPRITLVEHAAHEEDDSKHGFWGERAAQTYDSILTSFPAFRRSSAAEMCERKTRGAGRRGMWASCFFWVALGMGMLVLIGVGFAIDLGASEFGFGTGVAAYMVSGARHGSVSVSGGMREMHFCLTPPNRFAPTSQTWHYIAPLAPTRCTTQVLTLSAGPADAWKLHSSDELRLGNAAGPRVA